jgi:predicted metal-dependent peptidase
VAGELATAVCDEWDVLIRRACGLLEFDRSTFHYKACRREQAGLEARIKEIWLRASVMDTGVSMFSCDARAGKSI